MSKEDRKEEALKLKGSHKLYINILKDCPDEDTINSAEVADLSDCTKQGGRWLIPDYTPDWLYDIIDLYGGCELMESVFEFDSKETIKELSEICDVVIKDAGV